MDNIEFKSKLFELIKSIRRLGSKTNIGNQSYIQAKESIDQELSILQSTIDDTQSHELKAIPEIQAYLIKQVEPSARSRKRQRTDTAKMHPTPAPTAALKRGESSLIKRKKNKPDQENMHFNVILAFVEKQDLLEGYGLSQNQVEDKMLQIGASFLNDSFYQNNSICLNEAANLVTSLLFSCAGEEPAIGSNTLNDLFDSVISTIISNNLYQLLAQIIIKTPCGAFTKSPIDFMQIRTVLFHCLQHLTHAECSKDLSEMLISPVHQHLLETDEDLIEYGSETPIISYLISNLINCELDNETLNQETLKLLDNTLLDRLLPLTNPTSSSTAPETMPHTALIMANQQDLSTLLQSPKVSIKSAIMTSCIFSSSPQGNLAAYSASGLNQQQRRLQEAFSSASPKVTIRADTPPWATITQQINNGQISFQDLIHQVLTLHRSDSLAIKAIRFYNKSGILLVHRAIQSLICSRISSYIEIGESTQIDQQAFSLLCQNAESASQFASITAEPQNSMTSPERPIAVFEGLPSHHFSLFSQGFCPTPAGQLQIAALELAREHSGSIPKVIINIDLDINLSTLNPDEKYQAEIDAGLKIRVVDLYMPNVYPHTNEEVQTIQKDLFQYEPISMIQSEGPRVLMLNILDNILSTTKYESGEVTLQFCLGLDSHIDEISNCSRLQSTSRQDLPSTIRKIIPPRQQDIGLWFEKNRYKWCFTDYEFCLLYGFIHELKKQYPQADILISKEGGYNIAVLEKHAELQRSIIQHGFNAVCSDTYHFIEQCKSDIHGLFEENKTQSPRL